MAVDVQTVDFDCSRAKRLQLLLRADSLGVYPCTFSNEKADDSGFLCSHFSTV